MLDLVVEDLEDLTLMETQVVEEVELAVMLQFLKLLYHHLFQ